MRLERSPRRNLKEACECTCRDPSASTRSRDTPSENAKWVLAGLDPAQMIGGEQHIAKSERRSDPVLRCAKSVHCNAAATAGESHAIAGHKRQRTIIDDLVRNTCAQIIIYARDRGVGLQPNGNVNSRTDTRGKGT